MLYHLKITVFLVFFLGRTTGIAMEEKWYYEGYSENEVDPVKTSPTTDRARNPVIKLAIFYDAEFASLFDSKPNKIQKYWEIVLYDLHLRFQTLPNLHTSFRVTSLKRYDSGQEKNTPARSFHKTCKDDDFFSGSTTDDIQKVYQNFQTWAYEQDDKIPSFDIAVLALGPFYSGKCFVRTQPLLGSICKAKNDIEKKWMASAVISFQTLESPVQSPVEILAKQIATILGASADYPYRIPAGSCFRYLSRSAFCCIMNAEPYFPWPKFFSKCTDSEITEKLVQLISENKFCLDANTSHSESIIDSAELYEYPHFLPGYSNMEQCKLLLYNADTDLINAYTVKECLHVICTDQYTNHVISFTPMDGSTCGYKNKGRCFRGMCMQHEVQLVNVGTGKCLVSEKGIFGVNDKPILQQCTQVVTQALLPVVPEITHFDNKEALVIEYPYARRKGIVGKRLSMMWNESRMVFCSEEISDVCVDNILEIRKLNEQEFLLKVHNTPYYLHAAEDGVNIDLISGGDYSGYDKATRWKRLQLGKEAEGPHNDSGEKCFTVKISLAINHQEPISKRNHTVELALLIFWVAKMIY